VAEGGGLLNRYTVKSRIGGSNPPLSASFISAARFHVIGQNTLLTHAFALAKKKAPKYQKM
jgi:hypothetical protein